MLEWLERLAPVGGTLICLVRGGVRRAARQRLEQAFDTGDAALLAQFRALAADGRLRVIAGDRAGTISASMSSAGPGWPNRLT